MKNDYLLSASSLSQGHKIKGFMPEFEDVLVLFEGPKTGLHPFWKFAPQHNRG